MTDYYSITRDNFDYAMYMQHMGVYKEGDEEIPAIRDFIYNRAAQDLFSERRKTTMRFIPKQEIIKSVLDDMPDARAAFGIPEALTEEEEQQKLTINSFADYVRKKTDGLELPEGSRSEDFVDEYVSELQKDKWKHPFLSSKSKKHLKSLLVEQTFKNDVYMTQELLDYRPPPPNPELLDSAINGGDGGNDDDQPPEKTDNDSAFLLPMDEAVKSVRAGVEGIGKFSGDMYKSLSRSVSNQSVQGAASVINDLEGNYIRDQARHQSLLHGVDPDHNQKQTKKAEDSIADNPEQYEAYKADAAARLADAINSREEVPMHESLQNMFEGAEDLTVGEAFKRLGANLDAIPHMLAESGIDVVEELGTMIGVGATASAVSTPAGGLASGIIASSAVARENVYNDYFARKVEETLKSQQLEVNAENIKSLMDDEATMASIRDKADTFSNYIAAGSAAAGGVSSGLLSSMMSKVLNKMSYEVVTNAAGQQVLRQSTISSPVIVAANVATGTGLEVGADYAGTKAVGDEYTAVQGVMNATTSFGMNAADAVIGDQFRTESETPIDEIFRYKNDQGGENLAVVKQLGGDGKTAMVENVDELGNLTGSTTVVDMSQLKPTGVQKQNQDTNFVDQDEQEGGGSTLPPEEVMPADEVLDADNPEQTDNDVADIDPHSESKTDTAPIAESPEAEPADAVPTDAPEADAPPPTDATTEDGLPLPEEAPSPETEATPEAPPSPETEATPEAPPPETVPPAETAPPPETAPPAEAAPPPAEPTKPVLESISESKQNGKLVDRPRKNADNFNSHSYGENSKLDAVNRSRLSDILGAYEATLDANTPKTTANRIGEVFDEDYLLEKGVSYDHLKESISAKETIYGEGLRKFIDDMSGKSAFDLKESKPQDKADFAFNDYHTNAINNNDNKSIINAFESYGIEVEKIADGKVFYKKGEEQGVFDLSDDSKDNNNNLQDLANKDALVINNNDNLSTIKEKLIGNGVKVKEDEGGLIVTSNNGSYKITKEQYLTGEKIAVVDEYGYSRVYEDNVVMRDINNLENYNKKSRKLRENIDIPDKTDIDADADRIEKWSKQIDDEIDSIEISVNEEGRPVINAGKAEIQFEGDNANLLLDRAIRSSFIPIDRANDGNANGFADTDAHLPKAEIQKRVDKAIEFLPEDIKNMVHVHYTPNNPASQRGAYGIYILRDGNGEPTIHIDGTINASPDRIMKTVAEEVGHFSNESIYGDNIAKPIQDFISKTYDLFEDDILKNLQHYLPPTFNKDNPTYAEKHMLVQELTAKQGVSIPDIANGSKFDMEGITDADKQKIRDEAKKVLKSFEFDLEKIGNLDKHSLEDRRKFAMYLLDAQAKAVSQKNVQFDYKYKDGDEKRIFRVRNTRYGSATKYLRDDDVSKRIAHRVEDSERLKSSKFFGKLREYLKYHIFDFGGNGITDRRIKRLHTDNQTLKQQQDVRLINNINTALIGYNAIFEKYGINSSNYNLLNDGAENYLRSINAKPSHIKKAAEYDELVHDYQQSKLEKNSELKKLINDGYSILEALGTVKGNVDEIKALRKARLSMDRFINKLSSDWNHTRYRAYADPEDIPTLRQMKGLLLGSNEMLESSYYNAKEKRSNLPDDDTVSNITAKNKLDQSMKPLERLDHLKAYVQIEKAERIKAGENINELMIKEIDHILNYHDNKAFGYKDSKFVPSTSDVESMMARKLDPDAKEGEADYHKSKFLGKVENPLEVAMYNIQQLNEHINIVDKHNQIAKVYLQYGVAALTPDISKTKTPFSANYSGSPLQHLHIDPVVYNELVKQHQVESEMSTGLVNNIVGYAKGNFTYRSILGHTSNAWGALTLIAANGDFLRIKKLAELIPQSAEAFGARRTTDPRYNHALSPVVADAIHYGVIGGGTAALDLTTTQRTNIVDLIAEGLGKAVSAVTNKGRGAQVKDITLQLEELLKDGYVTADDIPKLIRFSVNYDLGFKKAKALGTGDNVTQQRNYAAEYAADKTLRENTDYNAMPLWAKKIIRNQARMIFANFLTHSLQAGKILLYEKPRVMKELAGDLKRAAAIDTPEGKQWRNAVATELAFNTAGVGTVGLSAKMMIAGGTSMLSNAMGFIVDMLSEDEKEDTERMIDGANTMLRFTGNAESGMVYTALPNSSKEDHVIYAMDSVRSDYMNFMFPSPAKNGEVTPQRMLSVGMNTFLSGSQGTIYKKLWDISNGHDWKGDKPIDFKDGLKNAAEGIAGLAIPNVFNETKEMVTGEQLYNNDKLTTMERYSKLYGVRIKALDPRKMIADISRRFKRDTSSSPLTNQILDELSKGHHFTDDQLNSYIRRDVARSDYLYEEYKSSFEGMRKFGYGTGEIIRYSERDTKRGTKTSVSKKYLGMQLSNHSPFYQKTRDIIKSKQNALYERKSGVKQSQEQINISMDNLKRFRKLYEFYIKEHKKKR